VLNERVEQTLELLARPLIGHGRPLLGWHPGRSLATLSVGVAKGHPSRGGVLLTLVCVALAGCGGGGNDDVERDVQAYFGTRAEVHSCQDADYEQNGLHLWKCIVYPGGGSDAETWNVALNDDGDVVDASPAR
jgi:hypothetical protein